MKTSVQIDLNEEVTIVLTGIYSSKEEDVNRQSLFEIATIRLVHGTLDEYTDYLNDFMNSNKSKREDFYTHFEELAIQNIENN
jgi:hypothetical protein